ncbi:RAI1-domain-containing protein [Rickenella mellea]|uniref:Decapping nuclease n=1 Tax=Rickenella mellea TaxID=50990 RepID=A0A4Y7PZD2_9AGAM|nr:RAI1-domain-containing protein [Rickenella mellea]
MSKRAISDLLNGEAEQRPAQKQRLECEEPAKITHRLQYPSLNNSPRPPLFQHPNQLISFSYSSSHHQEFTNVALKYFVDPPPSADLSFRYESWIKRPESRGRLDSLLSACLRDEVKMDLSRAGIVSWRGVVTKILTAPYEERDGWELNVMSVNGTIYLEEHLSEEKLKEKEDMAPRQRLQSYYGYAFESYCTSSTPEPSRHPKGWGGDINTNVQWCSVVKTKLGDNRMIIGGEVDCVRGNKYTGQPDTFVELKTSMAIRGASDEARFEKKLLKFYFQSFLLGVPEILVGFRTPAGIITTIQSFKTIQIPRLVRGKPGAWDPNICLDWGTRFIAFLKSLLNDTDAEGVHERHEKQQRVWRVVFTPKSGVEVFLLDRDDLEEVRNGEERVGFLPKSYWDEVTRDGRSSEPAPLKATTTEAKPVEVPSGWKI